MGATTRRSAEVWRLVRRQHGVITRRQLLALGYSAKAIRHRLADGRLHRVHRGVYAVGRPELSQHGRWMAAVLACGEGAALSHESAAALWGIRRRHARRIDVSVPSPGPRRVTGIAIHRRHTLGDEDLRTHQAIPVTSPICTLVDLAAGIGRDAIEAAVNEADRLGLVDPETLRDALDDTPPRRGVGVLRDLLDRQTFGFTRSELERRFRRLSREAGLPDPRTCVVVNGFEVDFYWPDLPLVVETDGLTYHRTPAQQQKDRLRDQAHTAAGIPHLRFTHAQVRDHPGHVRRTLARAVALAGTLVLLAGCGGDDDSAPLPSPPATTTTPAPEPPEPPQRGVVLELDRTTVQPGETLELTVVNHTKTRLEYGLAYRLEQRTGERWRWINRDAAFALILKIVEAGKHESEDIRLPNDLEPGRYRIVKSFMAPATGRRLNAEVEFRVS